MLNGTSSTKAHPKMDIFTETCYTNQASKLASKRIVQFKISSVLPLPSLLGTVFSHKLLHLLKNNESYKKYPVEVTQNE